MTKTVHVKRVRGLLKRKARNAQGQILGRFPILYLSSTRLIILQAVDQRVKIAAQIVTASLMMGQHRRSEKGMVLSRVEKVRVRPVT